MRMRNRTQGTMTIRLSVLYFAQVREATGVSSEMIAMTINSTLAELVNKVVDIHPRIFDFRFQVAVNRKKVGSKSRLKNGDEVAIFPPVTGG